MRKFSILIIQVLLFPFPWRIRRIILNFLPGFDIDRKARIGFSIVLSSDTVLEEGALIKHFNFVNTIDLLHMKQFSKIGRSNWITGANSKSNMFADFDRKCALVLGEHTRITAHHHIDCTGGVYIGSFTTMAGIRSQILTHSIDIKKSKQVSSPVYIGDYCFVGTASIILMGAKLPSNCVLGAGAVLNKYYETTNQLYAGNPAVGKKLLEQPKYTYFQRSHGHVS